MKYYYVGIYLRLSDEDDDKIDCSESIKNQRNLLIDEIKKHNNFILVDEYCDEDLSGAGSYRPEFERLIHDCQSGKINVVMCKSQSRFSRDMEIIEKYLHNKFMEWNVRFIGVADYADTEVIGNKKARQINGLVNEWYLEDVSNNIRSAFYIKMKRGEVIAPFAPFGYKIDKDNNNHLVIDENVAFVVKKIFQLYLDGYGYSKIVHYLDSHNIPSPSYYKYLCGSKLYIQSIKPRNQIKWNVNAIKTILTNQVYIGNLVQGKRTTVSYKNHKIKKKSSYEWIVVKNTHDAIIDCDTFSIVNNKITKYSKSIKNSDRIHTFSGKVFCSLCGSIMRKKNSNRHMYLVCSSYEKRICSNNHSIRYDELESIVLKRINYYIKSFYDKEIISNYLDHNNLDKLRVSIQNKIDSIQNCFKSIYDDKVKGIISVDRFLELSSYYDKEEDLYRKQLEQISNNYGYKINIKDFKKLNSLIIQLFIKEIRIGGIDNNKKRRINIYWNF